MKLTSLILSFFLFVSFVFSNEYKTEIGDTLENLLVREGNPTAVKELIIREQTFVNYYYRATNRSFMVDKETWLICDITEGKSNGNCFPCDKKHASIKCP
jgi:hypothetical protein